MRIGVNVHTQQIEIVIGEDMTATETLDIEDAMLAVDTLTQCVDAIKDHMNRTRKTGGGIIG